MGQQNSIGAGHLALFAVAKIALHPESLLAAVNYARVLHSWGITELGDDAPTGSLCA